MNPPIILTEHEPHYLSRSQLSEREGQLLWQHFGKYVEVEFPSPKNDQQWRLTAQGWVGQIPLSPDTTLVLQPKIPLSNLFRMLTIAYQVPIATFAGIVSVKTIPEFYERLALMLAQMVLKRCQRGLYRHYVERQERLPFVRGRLLVQKLPTVDTQVACEFETISADNTHNQLLFWTLHTIIRARLSRLPLVRQAYRALRGTVSLQPFDPIALDYDRLNADYRPMHTLCRFFLDHIGPTHDVGDQEMIPFLVNMPTLFERFVAQWLQQNLPPRYQLTIQERSYSGAIAIDIDLVLRDSETRQVVAVLDTKYKSPIRPSNDDIYQITFYANAHNCNRAILIYPASLAEPLDQLVNGVRIQSLVFDVSAELNQSGQHLLTQLILDNSFNSDTMQS